LAGAGSRIRQLIIQLMKVVTWNCRRDFEGKAGLIFSNSPDIAVIQECSKRSTEMRASDGYEGHWVGENPSIGMAVFCRGDWNIRQIWQPKKSDPRWIIPFEVEVSGTERFTLIAVWACQVKGNARASYVGQIHRSLREHPRWFNSGPTVIAGDFNSNAIWDKKRRQENHSSMVAALEAHGLISAYHAFHQQEHGCETRHTFYLYGHRDKPYHLDYVFVPATWREGLSVAVGEHCDWVSSDHCPVTIDVMPPGR
jgi:exodeoxyribonuclease-3